MSARLLSHPIRLTLFQKRGDALPEVVTTVTPPDPVMAERWINSSVLLHAMNHLFGSLDRERRIGCDSLGVFSDNSLEVIMSNCSSD